MAVSARTKRLIVAGLYFFNLLFLRECDILCSKQIFFVAKRQSIFLNPIYFQKIHALQFTLHNTRFSETDEIRTACASCLCLFPFGSFVIVAKQSKEQGGTRMEDEKGVNGMCKALEDMRREVAEETAEQMRVDHAIKLIKNGKLSFDEIAEAVDFPLDKVKEIAGELFLTV